MNRATDLALVAPGIDACDIGDYRVEQLVDGIEAGLIFLCNFGRDGLIDGTDSLEGEDTALEAC